MTPVKAFVWCGSRVWGVDHANIMTLICIATDPREAGWLAWSLARAHSVPYAEIESSPTERIEIPEEDLRRG